MIKTLTLAIQLGAFAWLAYAQPAEKFTNPLVRSQDAADPWMVRHEGY